MKFSIEPTIKLEHCEDAASKQLTAKPRIIKKATKAESKSSSLNCLSDICQKHDISVDTLMDLIDSYFSYDDIEEIDEFVTKELDDEMPIDESVDMSPDKLIDMVNDNDLKNLVKSAGVKLSGSENKDELAGMAKVLAAQNERFARRCNKLVKLETTKLKQHKVSKKKEAKTEAVSKFLK